MAEFPALPYFIANQALMSPAQKQFCQESPHLYWYNIKTPGIKSKALRKAIYLRDKGICQICGAFLNSSFFTIDHIIPFSKGGAHAEDNLQLACRPCNSKKGAKL